MQSVETLGREKGVFFAAAFFHCRRVVCAVLRYRRVYSINYIYKDHDQSLRKKREEVKARRRDIFERKHSEKTVTGEVRQSRMGLDLPRHFTLVWISSLR